MKSLKSHRFFSRSVLFLILSAGSMIPVFAASGSTAAVQAENVFKQGIFRFSAVPEKLEQHALRIFEARLKKRNVTADKEFEIKVVRNPRCQSDEFRISGSDKTKKLQLDCGSSAAFLYAVGKLLRTGNYADGTFTPGTWRGSWNPAKNYRCVYIASHFYNVYEVSPVEFMEEYLEDLALQGYNYLKLASGSAAKNAGTPEFFAAMARRRRLFKYAVELGMNLCVGVGNFGFNDSPQELRAVDTGHSFFGTEICTSNPAGLDYLETAKRFRLSRILTLLRQTSTISPLSVPVISTTTI